MNPQYMQPRFPHGGTYDYGAAPLMQPPQGNPAQNGPSQMAAMTTGPTGQFPTRGYPPPPPNPTTQGKQVFGATPRPFPPPGVTSYNSIVNATYQNGASQTPPPPTPQNYPTRPVMPLPNSSSNVGPPQFSHPQSMGYPSQSAGQQPVKTMYNQPLQTPNAQHQLVNQMSSMSLNPPLSKSVEGPIGQNVPQQLQQFPPPTSFASRPPGPGGYPTTLTSTLPAPPQPNSRLSPVSGSSIPPPPMQGSMQFTQPANLPPPPSGPSQPGPFNPPPMYSSSQPFPPSGPSGTPLPPSGVSGTSLPPPGLSSSTGFPPPPPANPITMTPSPSNVSHGQFDSVNGFGGPPHVLPPQFSAGPPLPSSVPNSTPNVMPQGAGPGQPQFHAHGMTSQQFNRMPPPSGIPPGPIHPSQQQQPRRLDPEMMPSPIQVIEDDKKNREGVFCTNQRGQVPPLVTTSFVTQDQGNCNPRFMRSSMYALPNSPDMMKQTAIPFTISISPFARLVEGEQPPPIVQFGELGPVRCIRCKAYMCPFMQFVDGGRRFQCSFCKATTEVPVEYFAHLDHTGQRVDKYERPELCLGSYEFIATKDYCKNNVFPMPPAFLFIIDVSYNNVKNGIVKLLCENMKNVLTRLPRETHMKQSDIQIGFITYSNSVHFYNLKDSLAQPQVMIVPDVQDMFMPLLDGFLVSFEESESIIDNLMEQIPKMYEDSRETETILGPAIKAGLEALKAADRTGKLFIFHSSLPIAEAPGKLKNRDDRKLLGTEKEKTILAPQTTFYNQLGQECVAAGCSVDLFTFPNAYIDIATIGQICRLTGGQLHKYTYFVSEIDGERLIEDLSTTINNQFAFDAIMRVRTSTGIRPTDFFGNFFMSNTTDVEVAAIDTEKGLCVEVKHDDKLTEEDAVYIQTAVLYTSIGGQRRLRIHNLSLNTCSQLADLYRNCELDVLMNYFSKACLRYLCDQAPKQVKDALINKCAQSLACYRKNCASPSSAGQLILPECMKLFPLYVNCLLKSDAIAGGSDMATDDRSYAMHALNIMDVKASLAYIYPRLIPIHNFDPASNQMPSALRCTAEKLKDSGAYLLENGIYLFIWIGLNVESDWLHDVFGVQSAAQIDIDKSQLLELDNPTSHRVRWIIKQVRDERQRYMKMFIIRQRDKLETVFRHFLVEDKGLDGSPSYVDFLCHIHKEIRNLLN